MLMSSQTRVIYLVGKKIPDDDKFTSRKFSGLKSFPTHFVRNVPKLDLQILSFIDPPGLISCVRSGELSELEVKDRKKNSYHVHEVAAGDQMRL